MKGEWNEVRLGDYITDIAAGPFGSNLKVECFVPSGFPIIDGANLKSFKVTDNVTKFVTEEKARSLHRSIAKRHDVIVTISGTVGQISYIPTESKYEEYLCSQRQFRATFDESKVDVPFLVYYFHSRMGQQKILSFANQVGVPALAQPLKNFREIRFSLPPLPTQRRIAAVLGALDDKIELNRKMNANLEAQAQALFKSWFVDFEPWGGKMPAGWKKGTLLDIADYTNGLAMQKFRPSGGDFGLPVLKIKELGQGSVGDDSERCSSAIDNRYVVENGDVVFSWSGTLLVDIWCGGKCGLNQHLFKVTSEKYGRWFIYLWTKHYQRKFAALAAAFATTMGHIKRSELEKAEVAIPDDVFYRRANSQIVPLIDLMVENRVESRKLAELRDALLPKLMSGELEVA